MTSWRRRQQQLRRRRHGARYRGEEDSAALDFEQVRSSWGEEIPEQAEDPESWDYEALKGDEPWEEDPAWSDEASAGPRQSWSEEDGDQ